MKRDLDYIKVVNNTLITHETDFSQSKPVRDFNQSLK